MMIEQPGGYFTLFDGVREINSVVAGNDTITSTDIEKMKKMYRIFVYDILG